MELPKTPQLSLYVAGASPQSGNAVRAVAAFMRDRHRPYDFTVVDVHRTPEVAYRDGVLTVPAVVLTTPDAKVTVSGNFSVRGLRVKLGAADE